MGYFANGTWIENAPYQFDPMWATPDPHQPGYYYIDDPQVSGGIVRVDAQGNRVGGPFAPGPISQGGAGFDINTIDPMTGGPQIVNYPTEAGGLFGLGDVYGSLAGVGLIAALGLGAYAAVPAAAAGAAGAGAEAGAAAGATGAAAGGYAGLEATPALLDVYGAAAPAASSGGILGTAASASPYLTGGSYALKGAGALTGNEQLSQAGTALGYAGTATGTGGSMAGDDWGSVGDWAKLAGTAVSAGATAYGAVNSANALNNQSGAAQDQADLAKALFQQTGPLRGLSTQQLQYYLATGQLPPGLGTYNPNLYGLDQFMQTGQLPQALNPAPTTAANRDVLEQQFGRAREQAINSTPAGGQLTSALTGLEGQRALGVTQLYANENQQKNQLAQSLFGTGLDISREKSLQDQNLRKALFSSALGLGSGNAQVALGGLAGASQGFGGVASNALKGTGMAGDLFQTLGAYQLGTNAYQQGQKRNVQNDLQNQFINNPNLF